MIPALEAPAPVGGKTVSLTMSPDAYQLLDDISAQFGESSDDLLRKALGLLKLASDARRDGDRLGIVDGGGHVKFEIEL